jgi:hypothetical protein
MRKTTILAAVMMLAFWGVMGTVVLVRAITPETTRLLLEYILPLATIFGLLTLVWFLRRRAASRRVTPTLEEVRRLSRQRLDGEPAEDAYVVLPSRRGHHQDRCGTEPGGHAVSEHPAVRPDTTQRL